MKPEDASLLQTALAASKRAAPWSNTALTGAACDDSQDNWQPPKAKKRRAKKEVKVEETATTAAVDQANFSYVSINKRDPFARI